MIVFQNGHYLSEDLAQVSVQDRGFLYGDGLFETVFAWGGKPFRWTQHWARLEQGAALLRLTLPYSSAALEAAAAQVAARNQLDHGLLRLSVSRGRGARGYSARGAGPPTVVLSMHPWSVPQPQGPPAWRVRTASFRLLEHDPLAGIKSANKLHQVLARMEAETQDAEEALLLNQNGHLAEASSGNVFWVNAEKIHTPPLSAGCLEGITRRVVLELCRKQNLATVETLAGPEALRCAEGAFLTLSSHGVVEIIELDGAPLRRSPLIPSLHRAYWDQVRLECSR